MAISEAVRAPFQAPTLGSRDAHLGAEPELEEVASARKMLSELRDELIPSRLSVSLGSREWCGPGPCSPCDDIETSAFSLSGTTSLCSNTDEGAEALIVVIVTGEDEVDLCLLKPRLKPGSPAPLIAPVATA